MKKEDYIKFCYELGLPPLKDVLKKYENDDNDAVDDLWLNDRAENKENFISW